MTRNTDETTALLGSSGLHLRQDKGPPGLSVITTTCYIFGLFSVIPAIALPGAIVNSGWIGFVVAVLMIMIETYTAILLGRSWLLIEVFWPQHARNNYRNPYPAIAEKAGGPVLKCIVSTMLNIAIFGAALPFLLLAAETLQELIETASGGRFDISFCYWLLVIPVILLPILCLGTPKDLNLLTYTGAFSVILVCVLIHIKLAMDAPIIRPTAPAEPTWRTIAYCFGAIAFQFDVHPMILTVQTDMKEKHKLPIALVIAFAAGTCLFLSITGAAYFLYGETVRPNLLNNFTRGPLLYIIMGIVAVQCLICLVLGINTLFQDLEEKLGIPDQFGWRRVALRASVMTLVVFVSESIPHFSVAIELVGGLLVTPFIFIFPPVFHILIKYRASGRIDVKEVVIAAEILLISLIGCITSTTESIIQLTALSEFAPPCYINITAASLSLDQIPA